MNVPRPTSVSHPQHVELGTVAHAGELLECLLCFWRKAVQLSDHELYDVVREAFGVNATQVPHPATLRRSRMPSRPSSARVEMNWIAKNGLPVVFS